MKVVKVAVNAPSNECDTFFDYIVPQTFENTVSVGVRIIVPFGKSNRSLEGMVVAIGNSSEFSALKTVKRIVDPRPVCSEKILELCRWLKDECFCSFSQALKLVLPPASKVKIDELVFLNPDIDSMTVDVVVRNSKIQCQIVKLLKASPNLVLKYSELYKQIKSSNLREAVASLISNNVIVLKEKYRTGASAKTVKYISLALPEQQAMLFREKLSPRATSQAKIIDWLCKNGSVPANALISGTLGSYAALKSLKNKGLIEETERKVERDLPLMQQKHFEPLTPNCEQQYAIDYLNECISRNIYKTVLLHGVTGSGKTEVFMGAIEHCLSLGKRALVTAPEISLTPQMLKRFVGRFGERVAVLHSALSNGKRFDEWTKINNCQADIVIGARSAIFAPLTDIGIIIMDEEHDDSYKSSVTPKYHTTDIALKRSKDENAVLLLASATPSLTSYYKTKTGCYSLLKLNHRYNNAKMPEITVVDMRHELTKNGNFGVVSLKLQSEIRENIANKEKTILFLNRRGYSTFVSCRKCGYVMTCDKCSVSMTYHKNSEQLICRYCGDVKSNVTLCPNCGSSYIKYFGTGTQKAQEQISNLFPNCKILRMDADVTKKKNSHETILNSFASGDSDILLGTQMITKGLDFHDVTLVGVLSADISLNIDDFRSSERTFSLLTQVCGRTGRGAKAGRAIIQTYQPQHYAIQLAQKNNYEQLYEQEIYLRKKLYYPPFCVLISVMLSSNNETETIESAKKLKKMIDKDFIVLGPSAASVSKVNNQYRQRLTIKIPPANNQLISQLMYQTVLPYKDKIKPIQLHVDINPANLT